MGVQDSIKVKILFNLQDGISRDFYWVKRLYSDIYWGSSIKGAGHTMEFEKTSSFSFQLPPDIDQMQKLSSKYSYHKSGEVHRTVGKANKYEPLTKWKRVEDIDEPQFLCSVITKHLKYYPETKSKSNRKSTLIINWNFNQLALESRYYIEFWVSTTYDISTIPVRMNIENAKYTYVNIGISDKLFLNMRAAHFHHNLPPQRQMEIFNY